jgi:Protein of unknown function (DUF2948)
MSKLPLSDKPAGAAVEAKLKLRAEDEEDLAVVSAFLQDALVPVAEMAFLPDEQRFVLVVNRFMWERKPLDKKGRCERTLTGIAFDAVTAVQVRGFERSEGDRILQILAIRPAPGAIVFEFSGADAMRLETGRIQCHLEDIGEPWPTPWRPRHPLDVQ